MKKIIVLLIVTLLLSTLLVVGCQKAPEGMYKDGVYYASEDAYNEYTSWKDFVTVTVEGGNIVDVNWGGVNIVPQDDKKVVSENHEYGMVENSDSTAYWYEQADAAEKWLIENQDPVLLGQEGSSELVTDTGTSVSIDVSGFFTLAAKALASEPIAQGSFLTDVPVVYTELPVDENGWINKADFVVANGTIVDVNFNALYAGESTDETAGYFAKDGTALTKKQIGDNYNMITYGGAQAEWYVQAATFEAYVVGNQAMNFELDDSGKTDTVAGVSITVSPMVEMFNAAFGQ